MNSLGSIEQVMDHTTNGQIITNNLPNMVSSTGFLGLPAADRLDNEGSSEVALAAIEKINNGNDITKQAIDHTDANEDKEDNNKFDLLTFLSSLIKIKNDNLPMVSILNISGEDLPTKTAETWILFGDKIGQQCYNSENQLTKQNGQSNDISCQYPLGRIEQNLKYY